MMVHNRSYNSLNEFHIFQEELYSYTIHEHHREVDLSILRDVFLTQSTQIGSESYLKYFITV